MHENVAIILEALGGLKVIWGTLLERPSYGVAEGNTYRSP